jgi:nucleoside-diphosphate-sugar epimerase
MRVLVTGANGFVGRAILDRLGTEPRFRLRAALRDATSGLRGDVEIVSGGLARDTDWSAALRGCELLVHTAARVHVMRDVADDSLTEYRSVNVEGTARLAEQAVTAGVRRFVFLSSIKVNGEHTQAGRPFRPEDSPAPVDPYGVSKLEAEERLREIGSRSKLEVVVIRPVLVYGPGVKANFLTMMRAIHRGVPLPLGAVRNRRSLVALDNLVDLVLRTLDHAAAPGGTFFVSDDEDLSTPDLLRRMGEALGRPPRLLPVPVPWLRRVAATVGKGDVVRRLTDCLQVDVSETKRVLEWVPPLSVDAALRKTASHFLAQLRA